MYMYTCKNRIMRLWTRCTVMWGKQNIDVEMQHRKSSWRRAKNQHDEVRLSASLQEPYLCWRTSRPTRRDAPHSHAAPALRFLNGTFLCGPLANFLWGSAAMATRSIVINHSWKGRSWHWLRLLTRTDVLSSRIQTRSPPPASKQRCDVTRILNATRLEPIGTN